MKNRIALALALAPLPTVAWAGEEPLYEPAPEWVTAAPAIEPAKLPADAPAFLILDTQQMLKDGTTWAYIDTAMRATSAETLTQMGTITLPWHPTKGDLIVHRLQILRGGETIDLLANGSRFSVIRREAQLEQHHINGVLSATLPVQGLRVGDIIRLSVSITRKDAALGGNAESQALLVAAPFRLHFGRARVIWPDSAKVNWRSFGEGIAAKPVRKNGLWEISIPLPIAKQPEIPGDAPPRYKRPPLIEASSFASWADVSKAASTLYVTKGLIAAGSPLAAEAAKIAAATSDPRQRAAAALQLVQDQVRYLFNGMGEGNYVPQSPDETWTLRYGDCKAKTLLLLALLHELDIEAEPVLANSRLGDWAPERLPAFGVFDHVLVRAVIGGESLWLDGTQNGTRLADLGDAPGFRNVLPARAEGAELMAVPTKPSARPDVLAEIEIDQSAGINLTPTYKIALTMRGEYVGSVRQGVAQASKSQMADMVKKFVQGYVSDATIVNHKVSFDDAAATARIEASGVASTDWTKVDDRLELAIDKASAWVEFDVDRARPSWKSIPVARDYPFHQVIRTRLKLPERAGFSMEGDTSLAATIAGADISGTAKMESGWLTYEARYLARDVEIAADHVAATREKLAVAQARQLRIRAPQDYPEMTQEVIGAKARGLLEPVLAAYQRDIEAAPDEAQGYINRANFLEGIYERRKAVADLDRAIKLDPSLWNHLWRARLLTELGEPKKALADVEAARELESGDEDNIERIASLYSDQGETEKALEMVDARIAQGGASKPRFMGLKAQFLADGGRVDEAIQTIDTAIATKPGDPTLLNVRCWLRGTRKRELEGALKDCTKAIELAEEPVSMLDSRAMVYFRMGRVEDALADLDAAYALEPLEASVRYLRGVIKLQGGNKQAGEADLNAARLLSPMIDRQYARYGITPGAMQ